MRNNGGQIIITVSATRDEADFATLLDTWDNHRKMLAEIERSILGKRRAKLRWEVTAVSKRGRNYSLTLRGYGCGGSASEEGQAADRVVKAYVELLQALNENRVRRTQDGRFEIVKPESLEVADHE